MFMFIAAAAIFAALFGGVVVAIRRNRSQVSIIDARLRMYCAR
jgi:hypothetical protein